MKRLVDELDASLRLVVELRYMEGRKLREIADMMSIPVGTVKSRLHKALDILRRAFGTGEER
jgi:RNA polymerase sigma-70 factor (ECF subfamily)